MRTLSTVADGLRYIEKLKAAGRTADLALLAEVYDYRASYAAERAARGELREAIRASGVAARPTLGASAVAQPANYRRKLWDLNEHNVPVLERELGGQLRPNGWQIAADEFRELALAATLGGGHRRMAETSGRFLEAVAGGDGRVWSCVLIEAGISGNNRLYAAQLLQTAAPKFENAPCFVDHSADANGMPVARSAQAKVGLWSNVTFTGQALEGRLQVFAPWLRDTLTESARAGRMDFLGLSIQASGSMVPGQVGGRRVDVVKAIDHVESVDVVHNPAAGGRFVAAL